jgi:hypothetical protein
MATPIFLLAPPRSFTSVVNAMIGQHPELFGVPELNLFNFPKVTGLWQAASDQVGFNANRRHGLLRTLAEVLFAEQTDETILGAAHWVAAREDWSTAQIFAAMRELVHPLSIVDKSPTYTMESERLYRIHEACPDARYIHLVRHPVKQCESVMKLNYGAFALFVNSIEYRDGKAHIEPQIAWHDMNVNIVDFLENAIPPDRYMRVRGESIMEHPKEKLREICRWLGIRDDEEAIDEMMHPERSPFACFGPVTALFGNDPNFLRDPAFSQRAQKLPSLDGPVSWRNDGTGLYPEVIQMAKMFGYQ